MPLHVVATPIGNLGDWSPRARDLVGRADLALCEDTRVTRRLLSACGVPSPRLLACHAHNESAVVPEVLRLLEEGRDVVLMTDAGTPSVSDPGGTVVAAVHGAGHAVRAVPGPSAAVAAWSLSGFPAPLHVLGFPPRRAGPLAAWLAPFADLPGSLVLFESGRRTQALFTCLEAQLGPDRLACLCRELTKLHEEVHVDSLSVWAKAEREYLGEVVVVIGPPIDSGRIAVATNSKSPANDTLGAIAEAMARRWGTSRHEAYEALLNLEKARS